MRTDGPEPPRRERPREAEEALRAVGEAIRKAQQEKREQEERGKGPETGQQ